MLIVISSILFVIVSSSIQNSNPIKRISFQEFKSEFSIKYTTEAEDKYRQSIFEKNMTHLIQNPCETCGVTQFFADTQAQIDQRLNLLLPQNINILAAQSVMNQQEKLYQKDGQNIKLRVSASATASSLDWRQRGAVTSVKAQGNCGTCWSFATVAMSESSMILQGRAIQNKFYEIDLSEQYLLKCTSRSNCTGGFLQNAIDKALKNGLPYQQDFPYNPFGPSNNVCSTKELISISNKARKSIYNASDSQIISLLANGPIAAAISATGWQQYASGIFRCKSNPSINHAVLIVGYDADKWIIKNSWGKKFGESGYIYVSRNPTENCGIRTAIHSLFSFYLLTSLLPLLLIFFI